MKFGICRGSFNSGIGNEGVMVVSDKIGGGHQYFLSGIDNRIQGVVQSAGGPHRHNNQSRGERHLMLTAKVLGDRLSDMRISGIGCIAVV